MKIFPAGNIYSLELMIWFYTQIVHEGFLEDINGILKTGEVPNLFTQEDQTQISRELKDHCLALGVPATKKGAYALFLQNVQVRFGSTNADCFASLGIIFLHCEISIEGWGSHIFGTECARTLVRWGSHIIRWGIIRWGSHIFGTECARRLI